MAQATDDREEHVSSPSLVPLRRAKPVHPTDPGAAVMGRLGAYSLRVSLLEQCQLSCRYCMPGSVRPYTANHRWLRAAQYARLASYFTAYGVNKLRFTGGEPLLRPDVAEIVSAWRLGMPDADLALTTNGERLGALAMPLAEAGLNRVTVHLDTLRPERYLSLMGPGHPEQVLEGVVTAKKFFHEVKLNVVVQKGMNEDEISDFLALSARLGVEVRFIELMNTGSAQSYVEETFVSGEQILSRVQLSHKIHPRERRLKSDPAMLFEARPYGQAEVEPVVFGLIASDTQPFCADCDRLRLTAEGSLRGCLYAPSGPDLGQLLRDNASDEMIATTIEKGLDTKRSHHPLVDRARTPFSMADIGG